MIIPEIEFRQIAVQVLLIAMLVHAAHALLEHGEVPFSSVRVNVAADVFLFGMVHGFVARHAPGDVAVYTGLIRH